MDTRFAIHATGGLAMLTAAVVAFSPAAAQTYDYVGVSNMGADIVVSGTFTGADVDDDGVLEWPNVPLEMSHFDGKATLFTSGSQSHFDWGLFDVDPFAFHKVGSSGLMSMNAEEHSDDLINGNEVHVDSTFTVVNSGNTTSNRFAADLELRVATDTTHGIGSGPLMPTRKLATPGSKFQYTIQFGDGGTPFDGGILLGSFILDDVDDPTDLQRERRPIQLSEAVFFDPRGNASAWAFEDGLASPPVAGGTSGNVEVHYQCGSPDIYCWGSVDDFVDLWTSMEGSHDHTPITSLTAMQVMAGTAMLQLPIESATMSLAGVVPLLSADFNGDGGVDGFDFLIWQASNGTTEGAAHADGDTDGDGDVDGDDFLTWQLQFQGSDSPPAGVGSGQVPEPTTSALLLTFMALLTTCRRSTRHELRHRHACSLWPGFVRDF